MCPHLGPLHEEAATVLAAAQLQEAHPARVLPQQPRLRVAPLPHGMCCCYAAGADRIWSNALQEDVLQEDIMQEGR